MLDQQIAELMDDEGIRLVVYDDATGLPIKPASYVKGHPTIGIGRALDVHGISQQEAAALLANDIFSVESELGRVAPWFAGLDPVRRGVMTNLGFNLGVHGLLSFARMIGFIRVAAWDAAADELQASRWARQVQRSRSKRLIAQLRTGELGPSTDKASNRPATQLPASDIPHIAPSPAPIAAPPARDRVDEDNIADGLNQAELDRIRGTGK